MVLINIVIAFSYHGFASIITKFCKNTNAINSSHSETHGMLCLDDVKRQ